MAIWSNWAGNQRCQADIVRPTSEPELRRIVADSAEQGLTVKAVGSGHSFTDIALSDHTLVDLVDYRRVLDIDQQALTVTVQAGCRLHDLSVMLAGRGLALENLGDIDVQTAAGATATATHGTGRRFGNLSSMIVGMRIVTAAGDVLAVDGEHHAGRLRGRSRRHRSAGTGLDDHDAGRSRLPPPRIEEPRRVEQVMEDFDDLMADNDHFEFFWVPHTGWALTKTNRRNLEPLEPAVRLAGVSPGHPASPTTRSVLVNRIGAVRPSLIPRIGRLLPSTGRVEYNDLSYRVFSTPRRVRSWRWSTPCRWRPRSRRCAASRRWSTASGCPCLPGRGALGQGGRHPVVAGVGARHRVHRRAHLPGHAVRGLLPRRGVDHGRLRGPTALGQAPLPHGRGSGPRLPALGASSRTCGSGSIPTACSPTPPLRRVLG